jgi:hypothetical protein
MCNPLAIIQTGLQVAGAVQQKNAADRAAAAAQRAGEFNASIIERDIELLEKTRGILNANFLVAGNRARDAFEREVQGTARAGFGYAGFDMSAGTPLAVLRENAREFDYEQKVAAFENSIQNMQIDDEQEGLQMAAELSRMEGGMTAASARASGTASMINSLSNVATTVYENPGDFNLA